MLMCHLAIYFKSSHSYLYSALCNTDCVKAALQCQQENSLSIMGWGQFIYFDNLII